MKIAKELLELLGIVKNPKSILDVGCGDGSFVCYLSQFYKNSSVYGLDINREVLANGIAKGNFQNANPVQGNARMLTESNPVFSIVNLDKEAYATGYVDWSQLREKEKIVLKDFDLVTAFNPYNRLSIDEVKSLMKGQELQNRLITVDVVGRAAKKSGYVLYGREIAHRLGRMYGSETPDKISEETIKKNLEILIFEGKRENLTYISHRLIENVISADLAVLFNKC